MPAIPEPAPPITPAMHLILLALLVHVVARGLFGRFILRLLSGALRRGAHVGLPLQGQCPGFCLRLARAWRRCARTNVALLLGVARGSVSGRNAP